MSIETKATQFISFIRLDADEAGSPLYLHVPTPTGSDTPLLGTDEAIATLTCPCLMNLGRYMTGYRRGKSHPLHQHILLVIPT